MDISPVTASWISKSLKTPYKIDVTAVIGFDFCRVEVYIDRGDKEFNKGLFDNLFSKKESIEDEYGGALVWERMSDKRACRIKDEVSCHPFELDDKIAAFEFMRSAGNRLYSVFHKRILDY